MVKSTLKRIFAIVGSVFTVIAAVLYLIIGIISLAVVSSQNPSKTNASLIIEFVLLTALALFFAIIGIRTLFGSVNGENKYGSLIKTALCFSVYQFSDSLFGLIFYGNDTITWFVLILSFIAIISVSLHLMGFRDTQAPKVVGITASLITAITCVVIAVILRDAFAAAQLDALFSNSLDMFYLASLTTSVFDVIIAATAMTAVVFVLITAIFSLSLIKDAPDSAE